MKRKYLLDLTPAEIEREITALGEPAFRARQLVEWVYQKKAADFTQFSVLPAGLRARLDSLYALRSLSLDGKRASKLDGTVRYTFKTHDGYRIYAVFLPSRDRNSVCLSTQVGCAVGCAFCASGKIRFKRNLTRGEILEQIIAIETDTGVRISGVLFMGMGEPLLNYDAAVSALRGIIDYRELGIGRRHVIVSTVGIIPAIRKLSTEKLGVRLAVSLHASNAEERFKIVSEKIHYSLKEIIEEGLYYTRTNNSRLTVEYAIVPGVNDSREAAERLAKLLKKSARPSDEVQVNLIPCNETKGSKWGRPDPELTARFKNILAKHDILATVREAKGADIGAACGQLGVEA